MGALSSENCPAFGPLFELRDMSTRPTVWSGKGRASQREGAWLSIVREIRSPLSRKLTAQHTSQRTDKTYKYLNKNYESIVGLYYIHKEEELS